MKITDPNHERNWFMKRTELEQMTKSEIIDMICDPPAYTFVVELAYTPKDPYNIRWCFDGGMSGNDSLDDFLENVLPRMIREETTDVCHQYEADRHMYNIECQ